jgi:hypothetical protein
MDADGKAGPRHCYCYVQQGLHYQSERTFWLRSPIELPAQAAMAARSILQNYPPVHQFRQQVDPSLASP